MEMKKGVRVVATAALLGSMLSGCVNTAVTYGPSYRELVSKDLKAANIDGQYKIEKVECFHKQVMNCFMRGDIEGAARNAGLAKDVKSAVTDALKQNAPHVFGGAANSVPVKIELWLDEKTNFSWGYKLNDFVSFLTLTSWPWYMSDTYSLEVEVTFPNRVVKNNYEVTEDALVSILPLGLIPVPASSADARRAYGRDKSVLAMAVRAVEAAFPQKK